MWCLLKACDNKHHVNCSSASWRASVCCLLNYLIVIFSGFLLCWEKITSLALSVLKHPLFHYLAFSKSSYLSALMMMMTVAYLFNLNSTVCYFLFSFFIRIWCLAFYCYKCTSQNRVETNKHSVMVTFLCHMLIWLHNLFYFIFFIITWFSIEKTWICMLTSFLYFQSTEFERPAFPKTVSKCVQIIKIKMYT